MNTTQEIEVSFIHQFSLSQIMRTDESLQHRHLFLLISTSCSRKEP